MTMYTYIEERYCTNCKRNVAIEHWNYEDGSKKKVCLNRECDKLDNQVNCNFRVENS